MKIKKPFLSNIIYIIFAVIVTALIILPVLDILFFSFYSETSGIQENETVFQSMLSMDFNAFSVTGYINTVNEDFLKSFGNSLAISLIITAVQLLFAICQGYCFAKIKFKFREGIFTLYVIMMVLPFQVTVVASFYLFNMVGVINTVWVILLPGIFSPFGAFLFRQFIIKIPDEQIEAALMDGIPLIKLFIYIIIPGIRSGITLFLILCFCEKWAAIEPALAFVNSPHNISLSVYLRTMMSSDPSAIFAPAILYVLPSILLYIFYSRKSSLSFSWLNEKSTLPF